MKRAVAVLSLALVLALVFAVVARHRQGEPSATASTASAPAAEQSSQPAPVAQSAQPGATNPGDLTAAATTQQETRDSGGADNNEASLEKVAALSPEGQLPPGKWVAGNNYTVLSPAQPTDAPPGKVEVVEMFWYGCPHCFALDPVIESWRKNKAPYIEFVRVPVTWAEVHRAHARLFYTLKALGKLEQLHSRVFEEIHQNHNTLFVAGDPLATQRAQLQFAKDSGISEADFMKAYSSFAVQTDISAADDLGRRYRIDAVPTFVIAGKYVTDMAQAGGESNLFELINDLAASEKHH